MYALKLFPYRYFTNFLFMYPLAIISILVIKNVNCQFPVQNLPSGMPAEYQQKMQNNLEILLNYLNDGNGNNNGARSETLSATQMSSQQHMFNRPTKYENQFFKGSQSPFNQPNNANDINPITYTINKQQKNPLEYNGGSLNTYSSPVSIDSIPVSLRGSTNSQPFVGGIPNQLSYRGRDFANEPVLRPMGHPNGIGGENSFNVAKIRWLRSQSGEAPERNSQSIFNPSIVEDESHIPRAVQLSPIPMTIPSAGSNPSVTIENVGIIPEVEPFNEIGDLELRKARPLPTKDFPTNRESFVMRGPRGFKFSKLDKTPETIAPPTESLNVDGTLITNPNGASNKQGAPSTPKLGTPSTQPATGMNSVKRTSNIAGKVISSNLLPKTSKQNGKSTAPQPNNPSRGSKLKPSEPELPPALPTTTTTVPTTTTTPQPTEHQNYKLIYFDARGICEPIRLLFHYSKVPFEDARITRKQWLALKDSTIYGKVPILEVDGRPLTYCHTISRFLARTFGLAGKTSWEEAKVDEVSDFHSDVAMDLQPYLYVIAGFHQGDRASLRRRVFLPSVEKHFPVYVNLLKQSGSGFFIPSGLTWIDFVISEYLTTIKHFEPAILDKYPTLIRFVRKVQTLPEIFDYIANREHQPVM